MARKKGKPPKSPSSQTSSRSPSNSIPKNLDLETLDDDDLEDIDALSPTKAASILQKLDDLRAKLTGKAIVVESEVKEVIQSQCEEGEGGTIVKETQVDNDKEKGLEVVQSMKEQKEEGCAMFRLMRNLEKLKSGLIDLKQRKYRNIDQKERVARDKLDVIQGLLQDLASV
ncbi:hypothetical protein RIF29_30164 [Crotalaria pallida]|uniref:Uncharacterized protein n=1 Tax=Crotalaria pallida TaxID=3830 RepID=A0AAN9I127_CROPI